MTGRRVRAARLPITVVLPTYNSSQFVDAQVESILSQTYGELQLRILDDCSTDGTYESLCAAYGDDPRVDLRQNEVNVGQNTTVERLLMSVDTPLFALSDHDDVWLPTKIADTVDELISSGSDLCYTDLTVVGPDLELVAESALQYSRMPVVRGRRPLPILLKNPVHGCTVVAHVHLLDVALPFPDHLANHDRWLALVAATRNGVSCVDRSLVRYRQHGANAIGALPLSSRGLQQRAGGRSARAITALASERLADRAAYLDALAERTGLGRVLRANRRVVVLPRPLRFLIGPVYLAMVSLTARELSMRTRLADAALVMIAARPASAPEKRHRIVTLDEHELQVASRTLAEQVAGAGYHPTHIVAIATAGTYVARYMAPAFHDRPVIVEIEARRPTTRMKRSRGVHAVLARCPRWLTTALRHLEYRLVTGRSGGGERTVSMADAEVRQLDAAGSTVRALVVDDCVDSGLSLQVCLAFLASHLGSGAELKAAALAMSLPEPKAEPEFCLYRNATLRGPWSIDA
jgi:hypoxanthine phosphoribosyltransferase